ncbi:O-antigen ligase family protein [Flagellimonas iocasae]|uniref:O-antigen ligase family protein n=1 Tax=Flagellimonas iocasae TaxID=2055905 RepID=A0ABW4Y245_9FLAO
MNQLKNISQFIRALFIESEEGKILSSFWTLLTLGLFCLPLGIFPSNVFLIGSIPLGIIYSIQHFRVKWSLKNIAIMCYPLLFIIMLISLSYSFDLDTGVRLLTRSIPLFFLPLIFLMVHIGWERAEKLVFAMIMGLLVSFLINLIIAANNSIYFNEGRLLIDTSLDGGHSFLESFKNGGNNFFGGELSRHVHPSYLSTYILICASYLVTNKHIRKVRWVIFVLLIYLFMLASRAAFLCLGILLIIYLFKSKSSNRLLKRGLVAMALIIIYFFLNPRSQNFYDRMDGFFSMEKYNYTTSEQSRALVYSTSIQLIRKSPIFGFGIGDANEELYIEYVDKNYLTLINNKYNAHNQYLQTLIQLGAIGFLTLIFPLALGLVVSKDSFILYAFLILTIGLLFESMLIRYHGIIFYAIWVPLLLRLVGVKKPKIELESP